MRNLQLLRLKAKRNTIPVVVELVEKYVIGSTIVKIHYIFINRMDIFSDKLVMMQERWLTAFIKRPRNKISG